MANKINYTGSSKILKRICEAINALIDSGVGYTLPTASSNTLGGVKVGNNLSIDENGVLSATGGGGGSSVYYGTTDPSSETGSNGSLYFKYHTESVYEDTTYSNAVKALAMTSNDYTDSNNFEFIASASNVYNNQQPYLAFNGTNTGGTDCWHPTSGTPQWIQLQFPSKVIITGFSIFSRPSNVEHPTAIKFQGSDDGSNWTDLKQIEWTATGYGLQLNVEVPAFQNGYFYYRWYITGVTSSPYGVIGEITFTDVADPLAPTSNYNVIDAEYVKIDGEWVQVM